MECASELNDHETESAMVADRLKDLKLKKSSAGAETHSKTNLLRSCKKNQSNVDICFPDLLSTVTCSELIVEFIKYVMYSKNQFPYQYNHLLDVVQKKRRWDIEKSKNGEHRPLLPRTAVLAAEKYFTKANQVVESLELIFHNIRCELNSISAVSILFGATIASPTEAYVVELPPLFDVTQSSLPSRGCLTHLIRELLTSSEMQQMTSKPARPTNIYILIRKSANTLDSWFDVKPLYTIPARCSQVHLRFIQPPSIGPPKFKIYLDASSKKCPSPPCEAVGPHEPEDCPVEASQWFQARHLIKGFKDCWIGDQCATDVWMEI